MAIVPHRLPTRLFRPAKDHLRQFDDTGVCAGSCAPFQLNHQYKQTNNTSQTVLHESYKATERGNHRSPRTGGIDSAGSGG
jgi:hypothetical protein